MAQDFPILIVDDDIVSRTLVKKYLNKAGFEVATADNGKQAMGLFQDRFFPIVLTDWMMPEIDGPQLCRLIRDTKTDGYVFIILITSRDSKTDIVSGLEAGADDYLTKPIHSAELIARIQTGIRILKLEKSLKQANEEIRLLSITDPLTGCYNRGYLNQHFPQELNRSRRYKRPLSIVLCDIDHFKRVNDEHGHQAGDEVLVKFSECILNEIRKEVDWVVRYGGEEFLIVLPETDDRGAYTMAERLRKAIAGLRIASEDKILQITSSFGGASITYKNEQTTCEITMDALIKTADDQLYQSKNKGRNRVTVFTCDFAESEPEH